MSRPKENRVRLLAHVLPKTATAIKQRVKKCVREASTIGRVLDRKFRAVK